MEIKIKRGFLVLIWMVHRTKECNHKVGLVEED